MERGSTIRIGERKHDQDWREEARSGLERESTIRIGERKHDQIGERKHDQDWREKARSDWKRRRKMRHGVRKSEIRRGKSGSGSELEKRSGIRMEEAE